MNVATEINKETLAQVAAESIAKINPQAKNAASWIRAIAKATVEVEQNPYLTYELDSHSLLILSEKSGHIYRSNGICKDENGNDCPAFAKGKPCYHRALARLIAIYLERFR